MAGARCSVQWVGPLFPIAERKKYFRETDCYRMIGADVRADFLDQIPGETAIVVMEGISMYLKPEELQQVLARLCQRFSGLALLMDCYTEFSAKASKYKNPINEVGVTEVTGLDEPQLLEDSGLCFLRGHDMTPPDLIDQLTGAERLIFRKLYAGTIARKMYRLYEYRK